MTQRITLNTPRLQLIGADATLLRTELAGLQVQSHTAFASAIQADVPAAWPPEFYDAPAVEWMLNATATLAAGSVWRSYYIALKQDCTTQVRSHITLVGIAGFKSAPDANGVVEVGYSVLQTYQRQGIASEAVDALIALAKASGAKTVAAETYPELVASLGVMRRCGMTYEGVGSETGTVRYVRMLV